MLGTCVANVTVSNRGKNEENNALPSQAKPQISKSQLELPDNKSCDRADSNHVGVCHRIARKEPVPRLLRSL